MVECDDTSEALFVHHKQVANNRYLHLGDRIRFDSEPNPRTPGQNRATNVEYFGHVVGRRRAALTLEGAR
jgi:cold shock CspA family protein